MNEFQWKTEVSGKDGKLYYAIILSAIVLLTVTLSALAYSLMLNPLPPIPVLFILFLCGIVLLHQSYQAFILFYYAGKTAKQIILNSNGNIIIKLFSNNSVTISKFCISKGVPASTSKLFPKNTNATIKENNATHYISGTTNDFNDLFSKLDAISNK